MKIKIRYSENVPWETAIPRGGGGEREVVNTERKRCTGLLETHMGQVLCAGRSGGAE